MRFSIFTPTHKPDYIIPAFDSLTAQTFTDWEWVIVPNGDAVIPEPVASHPQVRVIRAPDELSGKGVGSLKLFACEQCRGEYFVELDHDDLLTENALEAIDRHARETNAGFLYSDFSNFYEGGTCQYFYADHGWEQYPFHWKEREYIAMRAFATDASSLHLIFYAPNHVRVWSRQAYFEAGGHDPSLHVVDDHDLICRTYLTGTHFEHIPECLYLYRLLQDGGNTYLRHNADIQRMQQDVANKYVYQMTVEWCRRNDYPMLDLGEVERPAPGFKSVALRDADINCDIRKGLPFPDSSVGCIRAYDFLQRVPGCTGPDCQHGADGGLLCTVGLMNEIYRVLAPGGWLLSRTPSTDGRGAFQDPAHVSFWNPNSFWYYTNQEFAKYVPGFKGRFQDTRVWQSFPTDWHKENNIAYVYADLVALKGQRQPGLVKI
ncbi:MAG TPA: glycosyltransferase [Thiolinea sp.]|nr:glycosyltransferase [Thiolinea sp.]